MKLSCRIKQCCRACPYDEIVALQQRAHYLNRQLRNLEVEKKKLTFLLSNQDIEKLFEAPLCYYDGFTWQRGERVAVSLSKQDDKKNPGEAQRLCPFTYGKCEGRQVLLKKNLHYLRRRITEEVASYNVLIELLNHSFYYHQGKMRCLETMYLAWRAHEKNTLIYADSARWQDETQIEYEMLLFSWQKDKREIEEKRAVLVLRSTLLEGTCCYLPAHYQVAEGKIDNCLSIEETLLIIEEMGNICQKMKKKKHPIGGICLAVGDWEWEHRCALTARASQIGAKVIGKVEAGYGYRPDSILLKQWIKKE